MPCHPRAPKRDEIDDGGESYVRFLFGEEESRSTSNASAVPLEGQG
jgi:hypothetical protein